jgi:hypothetical protein
MSWRLAWFKAKGLSAPYLEHFIFSAIHSVALSLYQRAILACPLPFLPVCFIIFILYKVVKIYFATFEFLTGRLLKSTSLWTLDPADGNTMIL